MYFFINDKIVVPSFGNCIHSFHSMNRYGMRIQLNLVTYCEIKIPYFMSYCHIYFLSYIFSLKRCILLQRIFRKHSQISYFRFSFLTKIFPLCHCFAEKRCANWAYRLSSKNVGHKLISRKIITQNWDLT